MKAGYSMEEGLSAARQAAREIEAWLWSQSETVDVHNVEEEPAYQQMDVDLLWTTERACCKVEIKGDRLGNRTGNFFFETLSNKEKNTPGCFLYTEADLLFYYFLQTSRLYVLPMPTTRAWFLENLPQFPERETSTPVGEEHYTTVGRLVPVKRVLHEVAKVWDTKIPRQIVF